MTIWLFGDSIFEGAILDTPPGPDHPLWPIRAPAQMMNLMAGEEIARFGSGTMIPSGVAKAAAAIRSRVASEIVPADTVVMLDVGPHSGNPEIHRDQWLTLRQAAAPHAGQVIICEGFDNGAQGRPNHSHREVNDAVRAAAESSLEHANSTMFMPTHKPLLRLHYHLLDRYGFGAFRRDGIHLNPWGQARLCWLILEACGLAREAMAARWRTAARTTWAAMGAAGPETATEAAEASCAPPRALFRAT